MSTPITIVDLGLGNLRSVLRAVQRAGGDAQLTSDPDRVAAAERLVVPGQGGFADGARALGGAMGEALAAALADDRPYLGICLGMQLLFERSEEAPQARGLGVVRGSVRRFDVEMRDAETGERLKVPHVGWNEVVATHDGSALGGWYYFVHSYYCAPDEPDVVVATADYGGPFCAAVARGSMLAVQFHPEKSHDPGRRLLERFVEGRWS